MCEQLVEFLMLIWLRDSRPYNAGGLYPGLLPSHPRVRRCESIRPERGGKVTHAWGIFN